jgi:hypothetical protein
MHDPMSDKQSFDCLRVVATGAVLILLIPIAFGACWIFSYFADPGLRATPDQYGNPISPAQNLLIPAGIILVVGAGIAWVVSKAKGNLRDECPEREWRYTHYVHFWRPDDNMDGTRKWASWYEAWHATPPDYFLKAVRKCDQIDPYHVYRDAVVVKSWVEDCGDKAIIHDGVVTVNVMKIIKGEPISKGIKPNGEIILNKTAFQNYMMVSINEVSEWRVRK